MDKKPLIVVSLCAVVLLVLGSLSNVVGYQSVKSTAVNDSPLFKTRTQKATNQQQNILVSQYLGKGYHSLSFPLRDNNNNEIQKFISQIRTMDENTFKRYASYIIDQMKHNDNFKGIDVKEFIDGLHQLRESKQNIIAYEDSNDDRRTWFFNFVATACWIPGCLILSIILIIYILINLGPTLYPIPCGL